MRYEKNIAKHREWMLRAYVISYAIVLMRPVVAFMIILDPSKTVGDALAIVGPVIWTLSFAALETRHLFSGRRTNKIE
jgi:hypothetical protein